MDPILIPTWITTLMLSWQVHTGIQHNARYNFVAEPDGTILVMDTQDGSIARCNKDYVCEPLKKFEPKKD